VTAQEILAQVIASAAFDGESDGDHAEHVEDDDRDVDRVDFHLLPVSGRWRCILGIGRALGRLIASHYTLIKSRGLDKAGKRVD
jgi:hypothetical protein